MKMIKLTSSDGRAVYVAPAAVAGIQQLPSCSATRSVVRLVGGKMIEVLEEAELVASDVDSSEGGAA